MNKEENLMSKKTNRNIVYSIVSQIVIMLLTFVNRQYFVACLGSEILGINGVILNILSILQLADLGIGTALTFFFYQPLAEKNYSQISKLLKFARAVYRIIAILIVVIGLLLLPFLELVIKTSVSNIDVIKYYCLILCNSVLSYMVIYKSLLLMADQKIYIINIVKTIIAVAQNIAQIFILKTTSNYFLFLLLTILGTICNNLIVTFIAGKQYKGLIRYDTELTGEEKTKIWTMIKSTALYRIGVIIVTNTDNILISILVNTVTVGFYSNYHMVVNAVNTFINTFISAITARLGEINTKNDKQKSYEVFRIMLLVFHYISMFCSISLLLCISDFIELMFGIEYTLKNYEVIAIVFCFYVQHAIDPVWIFRETMGLFNEIKYIMSFTALLNLIFSFAFGKVCGLAGVVAATAIARICTTVWYEPRILFRKRFEMPVFEYFSIQGKYLGESVFATSIACLLVRGLNLSFFGMIIKVMVAFMVSTICIYVANIKTLEMIIIKNKIREVSRNVIHRLSK